MSSGTWETEIGRMMDAAHYNRSKYSTRHMKYNNTPQTIDWIQALRGIAAVLVVFTHARVVFTQGLGQEIAWKYLVHGAIGVDLFFIISGFIMVLTTTKCDGSGRYVADFVIKRFSRIWPLLFVVSLIYFLLEWRKADGFPVLYFSNILKQLVFYPVSPKAADFFALPTDLAWTLCFEAYFYSVVAISLFFPKRRWWIVAAVLSSGLIIYPIIQGKFDLNFYDQVEITVNNYLNLAVHPIVWDFIFGLIAGKVYFSLKKGPPFWVALLLLMLVFCAVISVPFTHQAGQYGPTIAGGGLTMFAVFLMILAADKTIKIPVSSFFIWLGAISYSMYLTHRIGFILAKNLVAPLKSVGFSIVAVEWIAFSVYVACGIAAGAFFHYYVELPLSAWVKKKLQGLLDWNERRKSSKTQLSAN